MRESRRSVSRAGGDGAQVPPRGGDAVVLDSTYGIEDRIKRVSRAWIADGHDSGWLISGKAFFLVYCWAMKHKVASPESGDHDAEIGAFVAASLGAVGGADGWSRLLAERATCLGCNDQFRLENMMICTGCTHYFCGGQTDRCVCRCGEMVG